MTRGEEAVDQIKQTDPHSMTKRENTFVSLSLAGLAYTPVWSTLVGPSEGQQPVQLITLLLQVVALTAILVVCFRLAGRRPNRSWVLIFPGLVGIVAVKGILELLLSRQYSLLPHLSEGWRFSVGVGAGVLLIACASVWQVARRGLIFGFLILSPLAGINCARALWKIAVLEQKHVSSKDRSVVSGSSPKPTRVVWIIFDEWDYAVTFSSKPADLPLPELERFRKQSTFASNVRSPNRATQFSVPALVTARPVRAILQTPQGERVQFETGDEYVSLAQQPNIFKEASARGIKVAVTSSGFDYCAAFNPSLTYCKTFYNNSSTRLGSGFRANLINQPRSLFETEWRSLFGQSLSTQLASAIYLQIKEESLRLAADPHFEFVLLHLPIPHPPYFYDRRTGRLDWPSAPFLSAFQKSSDGYVNNLALVDITLRAVRESMQANGTWDSSAILLSSDHPIKTRQDDDPMLAFVPFFLKMPNQKSAAQYADPVDSLVTKDLLLDILNSRLSTASAVPAWLRAHRSCFPLDRPIYPKKWSGLGL